MKNVGPKCALCGVREHWNKYAKSVSQDYGIRKIGKRFLCDSCTQCRKCHKMVRDPRRRRPLCKACLREQAKKIALRQHARKNFSGKAAEKRRSLDDLSTKLCKLYPFIRFEKISYADARYLHHNGLDVPVIEVGMFYNFTQKRWERVSQSGTAKITSPLASKPNLKGTFTRVNTVIIPDFGSEWYRREARNMLDLYTERLRKHGWRVVAVRDERGHRSYISGYENMTWAEEQAEIARRDFDENMGRRHVQTLERIDRKYEKNEGKLDAAAAWIGETVHNSMEAA